MTARRVVVVGAGVVGLLTAIECALAGHRVVVADRGPIPNPDSTSYDQHRAIHPFAPGDPDGTRQLAAAHRRWVELEALLGGRLYRRVGVVTAWPDGQLDRLAAAAAEAGLPVAAVEPAKLPHLGFPPGTTGLLEAEAGVLLADRVLHAATAWLAAHPAVTLRPDTPVRAVEPDTARVTLAGGEVLAGDLVLVAAGPWAAGLVEVPVQVYRQTMVYLRPPESLRHWWETAPAAGRLGEGGRGWLLPPGGGTLLKVSTGAVCRAVPAVTEDDSGLDADIAAVLAAGVVSDVDSYEVVTAARCHYAADAETGAPLLARVGPAVWSRAACAGSGFAAAPVVAGQILDAVEAA
jgi:glycine/D-amino acid oxidase-like deaminating enzyme